MTAIAAVCENGGIGREGALLFHIREDLRRFRQLTLGKTVVMGRRTLESLPGGRGLPDRRNLVLTRDTDFTAPGAEVIHDLAEMPPREARQRQRTKVWRRCRRTRWSSAGKACTASCCPGVAPCI